MADAGRCQSAVHDQLQPAATRGAPIAQSVRKSNLRTTRVRCVAFDIRGAADAQRRTLYCYDHTAFSRAMAMATTRLRSARDAAHHCARWAAVCGAAF